MNWHVPMYFILQLHQPIQLPYQQKQPRTPTRGAKQRPQLILLMHPICKLTQYSPDLMTSSDRGGWRQLKAPNSEQFPYDISNRNAEAGFLDNVVRGSSTRRPIKPSANLSVLLRRSNEKPKRFSLDKLILYNAKPHDYPIGISKCFVRHKDGNVINLKPDNLYWTTDAPKHVSSLGHKVFSRDKNKTYNSKISAKRDGAVETTSEYNRLEEGESFIETNLLHKMAETSDFTKWANVRVTN